LYLIINRETSSHNNRKSQYSISYKPLKWSHQTSKINNINITYPLISNRVNKVPKTFPEFYFSNMKLKREIGKFCEMALSPGENVNTILQMLFHTRVENSNI
jgi:hypothetical protein